MTKFSPARLRRPFYAAAFPKKAHVSLGTRKGPRHALRNSRSFPRYPSPLERNAEIPATSQEEPRCTCLKARQESIALLPLERNADIPVPPREEAGIYLTLEGNPGDFSQFESHVIPHPLEIRPDFLVPIRMWAENQLTTRSEF